MRAGGRSKGLRREWQGGKLECGSAVRAAERPQLVRLERERIVWKLRGGHGRAKAYRGSERRVKGVERLPNEQRRGSVDRSRFLGKRGAGAGSSGGELQG